MTRKSQPKFVQGDRVQFLEDPGGKAFPFYRYGSIITEYKGLAFLILDEAPRPQVLPISRLDFIPQGL